MKSPDAPDAPKLNIQKAMSNTFPSFFIAARAMVKRRTSSTVKNSINAGIAIIAFCRQILAEARAAEALDRAV
jgi:hypothetical protein